MKHQKIKRVFYYLFHDGIRGVSKVLDDRMLMGSDLKLELVVKKQITGNSIKDYPEIVFKGAENPLVSIIIPVYNHQQ